jgi:hypothetical protein
MHEEPANAAINKLRKKALRIERNLDSDTDDETLLDYEKRRKARRSIRRIFSNVNKIDEFLVFRQTKESL